MVYIGWIDKQRINQTDKPFDSYAISFNLMKPCQISNNNLRNDGVIILLIWIDNNEFQSTTLVDKDHTSSNALQELSSDES